MERLAGRLWNDFYDNHRANFFKDRHWLGREWPQLALEGGGEETEEPGGGSGVGVVEVRHCFLLVSNLPLSFFPLVNLENYTSNIITIKSRSVAASATPHCLSSTSSPLPRQSTLATFPPSR